MLKNNRIDIVIMDDSLATNILSPLNNKNSQPVGKPLYHEKIFHYLHKKHHKLIPKLSEVL